MKQLFRFRIVQALIPPFDHIYSFHRTTFYTEKRLQVIAFSIPTSLSTGIHSHCSIVKIAITYTLIVIDPSNLIEIFIVASNRFDNKIVSISNFAGETHRAVFVLDNKGKFFKVTGAVPQDADVDYHE